MNRSDLFRAVDLCHAAAHSATLSASYDKVSPERSEHFARLSEEALYAALDAIAQARMGQRSFLTVAAEIVSTQPELEAAA